MARIVGVHGINQEFDGSHTIYSRWLPALKDGLERANATLISDDDFKCAFYGDLFRESGQAKGTIPNYDVNDIDVEWESEFLQELWGEVLKVEEGELNLQKAPVTKARTPRILQEALSALSQSRFFGGVAEKFIIAFMKQVRLYLYDSEIRQQIRSRVADCITEDTRVLVGHSLGSIACYESLCQHPEWPVKVLVTLGSPLGIQRLIFDRLEPTPTNSQGSWPGKVDTWINIADVGDIVALEKKLDPYFQGDVIDQLVNNGADAHNANRYFTAKETGEAIKLGLEDA
ncbi:hypothetical protein [Acaryochloris sp. IP29b_bin.137]|uniref:hypothetical protein n=1 Tax=Acaryochloris sp. IP29b_bin.137 TaxID=2969217 RepID=UPI00262EEBD0|nr:hypothetical protein [Acaryochloris sp. IP29b_bin.137]